jgi:hypothetical protein
VSTPITICIMRNEEIRTLVERAVAGQKLGDRPVAVQGVDNAERARACHILYLGVGDGEALAETLRAIRGAPTLTVTDGAFDPATKGVINFVIENNRVRFEIDDHRAAENGLLISSKLLSLAVSVRPRT